VTPLWPIQALTMPCPPEIGPEAALGSGPKEGRRQAVAALYEVPIGYHRTHRHYSIRFEAPVPVTDSDGADIVTHTVDSLPLDRDCSPVDSSSTHLAELVNVPSEHRTVLSDLVD